MVKRSSIPAHRTNYYDGRLRPVLYIVIHTGETGEGSTPAEGMGNWFATDHGPGRRSSAHRGADTDSVCIYVDDEDTAFGAPGVNATGWHLELAGRAGQTTAQWDDADSRLILANGAEEAADASKRLRVPARWLSDDQLRSGVAKGFITHAQASRVLGGTHWDPGPNFPAEKFMALVVSHLGGKPASAIPNLPAKLPPAKTGLAVDRAKTRAFQQLLELPADGLWGATTDEWAMRMRTAARAHVGYPLNVVKPFREDLVQRVIDVTPDGIFGPLSKRALRVWVAQMQRLLGLPADGLWGPATDVAFTRFRTANRNKF